ncbi:hypothetical protein AX15_003239 [Amanita polypyramis BW_CC]|nr:hypothetical protein AX15_003239 [Amanita polypyramis BW_CC]
MQTLCLSLYFLQQIFPAQEPTLSLTEPLGNGFLAAEDFTGFEAAHIFPLSETDIWNDLDYKRFIEDDNIKPGFEMNSVQQGFLCSSTEHRMFDDYSIGINQMITITFMIL